MKKTIRILAAILAYMLTFSCMPISAEETAATEKDELYAYIAEVYKGLGIFGKNTAYFEDETVSRSRMAEILYDMTAASPAASENARHYVDVKPGDKAYEKIESVAVMGILNGNADGYFLPDKTATYDEAIKTMVCAIGYKDFAEVRGGFPAGYSIVANDKRMTQGMKKVAGSSEITGRDMAVLVYNTLRADIMQGASYKYYGGGISESKEEQDEELLYKAHKIIVEKGVVESDETADLYGDEPCKKGKIKFDGVVYDSEYKADVLGYFCEAYIKDTDADDEADTIVYIGIPDGYNEVTVVDAEDITSYDSLSYKYGTGSRLRISRDTSVLYNGRRMTSYDEKLMQPEYGYIELIKHSNSDDDVLKIHDRKTIVVGSVSNSDYTIVDKYDTRSSIKADVEDDDNHISIYDAGEEIAFVQIEKNNVLTIEQSQDGKVIRIYKSAASVKGVVEGISDDEIKIDGATYDMLKGVSEKAEIKAGDVITLLLDINGKAAGKTETNETVTDTGWHFGICLKSALSGGMDARTEFKVFNQKGDEVILTSAENVTLDGKKVDGSSSNIENGIKLHTMGIFRYKLNDAGEVSHIDTLAVGTGDERNDCLRQFSEKNAYYYSNSNRNFSGKVRVGSNTTIIQVRPVLTGETEDDYKIVSGADIEANKQYSIESFAAGNEKITPDIIFFYYWGETDSDIPRQASFMSVKKLGQARVNGDEYKTVTGIYDGYEQTFMFRDTVTVSGINKGDIIRFGTNAAGEIIEYEKVYDRKEKSLVYPVDLNTGIGNIFYTGIVNVWSIKDNNIVFVRDDNYVSDTFPENALICGLGSPSVYVYETKDNGDFKVSLASVNDIAGYKENALNPSKILVNISWYAIKEIFIMK